ncbi:MAG: hypothetical protein JHD35_22400 [Sphingopyxis sp.]|nr:hypothetical protein [Sphingopyxis sp.]
MVDNRFNDRVIVKRKAPGQTFIIVLLAVVAIVGVLFATGFWSADVKEGDLPEVSVNGGELPKVDVDSKAVVVGTKKKEIDVPTVGVKDNGEE